MREIVDKNRLEHFFGEQQAHFRQRPPVLKLVEFEKGEILNDPLQPLNRFYIIVRGSVSIYHLTEDGSIRYISKAASGTLLGDMEFSVRAINPSILRPPRRYCALTCHFGRTWKSWRTTRCFCGSCWASWQGSFPYPL